MKVGRLPGPKGRSIKAKGFSPGTESSPNSEPCRGETWRRTLGAGNSPVLTVRSTFLTGEAHTYGAKHQVYGAERQSHD